VFLKKRNTSIDFVGIFVRKYLLIIEKDSDVLH